MAETRPMRLPVTVAGITIGWIEMKAEMSLSDLRSIKPEDIITTEEGQDT